jgi:hypothetical protein
VRINNIPCSIHITYRMSGKSLRPMAVEAYTHPKHELIPGALTQKIAQAHPSGSDLIDERYDRNSNDLCCSFLSQYILIPVLVTVQVQKDRPGPQVFSASP